MKAIVLGAAVLAGAACACAAAAAFPPLQRQPVLQADLPGPAKVAQVKGAHIRFAPSQSTGLHLHPMPVVGVVTEGAFVFQPQGQPLRTLHVGEGFYEPANVRILRFDNASKTEPAAITAFYLAERPGEPLIKMLAPGS